MLELSGETIVRRSARVSLSPGSEEAVDFVLVERPEIEASRRARRIRRAVWISAALFVAAGAVTAAVLLQREEPLTDSVTGRFELP